ncbi:MAG: 5'-3' exonuclease [Actinomycetota bacterium]
MLDDSLTLLIDASSLIYRALFSTPDTVRAPDGAPVNAAHGFLGMMARLIGDQDPDFVACAADEDWRPRWRVELIGSYKTHRLEPGSVQARAEEQLRAQLPIIFRMLDLCRIRVVGWPGFEAEDVIGTLSTRAPGKVAIVSGDRDLFQLVADPRVWILYPKRGVTDLERVDEACIRRRFGIPGRSYRDFSVLRGDASDGLPGVRGIGEKTAASLLERYGSLEAILEAAIEGVEESAALRKVAAQLDYIDRAVQVVTLPSDLPLPELDLTRPRGEPQAGAREAAERYGLTGALRRLVAALNR